MLELRIKHGSRHVPLHSLPARLGSRRARIEIGATVESLIAYLDELGGDPDLEDDQSDFEETGDEKGDPAWCEWLSLPASTRRTGKLDAKPINPNRGWLLEDEEQDDAPEDDDEDCCRAGEDDAALFSQGHQMGFGWCKSASDPDAEYSGDEQDTGDAEDEHLSNAHLLGDDTAWTKLDRGISGGGSDTRPGLGDRQLEINDN